MTFISFTTNGNNSVFPGKQFFLNSIKKNKRLSSSLQTKQSSPSQRYTHQIKFTTSYNNNNNSNNNSNINSNQNCLKQKEKNKLHIYYNLLQAFSKMDANFANDLKNETISKVTSSTRMKNGLITVKRSDSLDIALKVLSENDISSCPVIDPKLGCMGLVDMFDIIEYVLSIFKKQMETSGGSNNIKPSKLLGMNYFKLNLDPVSVVINKSHDVETLVPVVTEMDNVFNLIQLFAMGCHRVPVYAATNRSSSPFEGECNVGSGVPRLNRLISQTDLAIWAWQNPLIRNRIIQSHCTVENYYHPNPKCVNQSTPTIEVLKLLHDNKISSVAVVDDRGKIKNEISTDSWKGINEKNLDLLFEDVKTYLKSKQKREGKQFKQFSTCSLDTPIQDIWQKVNDERVHRVWVVNDKNKLVGIISLVDLLKSLMMISNEN